MAGQADCRQKAKKFCCAKLADLFNADNQAAARLAFTLAEVLITLGIIGVVAAMTIPVLVQRHQEKATITKVKKVYSTLSQALNLAVNENGTVDTWDLNETSFEDGAQKFLDMYFKPYFKIADLCETSGKCIGSNRYKYLNGVEHISYQNQGLRRHFILDDGTLLIFQLSNYDHCSDNIHWWNYACVNIDIDVNGYFRGPNQYGKDVFTFIVSKDKIRTPELASDSTKPGCLGNYGYGSGCSTWLIEYENMDYLHCNDLKYGVKTKCN